MPVVLDASHFDTWMRGTADEATPLLAPYGGGRDVGGREGGWHVRYNGPELIERAAA
jgi:putative SOS response-associated peptidase YedK